MSIQDVEQMKSLFPTTDLGEGRATMETQHYQQALNRAKLRMKSAALFDENQIIGRRITIGCVALEITQRCNLDCTLCYLSENAESVKDIPLPILLERIDRIKEQFGAGTNIQITGGDPTLGDREELLQIVRYVREVGMCPTLMTNGILATRELLTDLAKAGLYDVAFHVDITQERKGFANEVELNAVRKEYIDRARGLGMHIIFNLTVCEQNYHEIPEIVRFFKQNTDVVGMASFQMQADTGRGVLRQREEAITMQSVRRKIVEGAGIKISWDTILVGHPRCHKAGITVETNGKLYDLNDDPELFNGFIRDFSHLMLDRRNPLKVIFTILSELFRQPKWLWRAIKFLGRRGWEMKWDLLRSGGKARKLTFFVQNFMDAENLEAERVHACSFMVMTQNGPLSMCAHNAKRDEFILKPQKLGKDQVWMPLTGDVQPASPNQ